MAFNKVGKGQVEPNHLSAQRTAQIYAQLPAAAAIAELENGQYVKYDYANGEVNFSGSGEWMMVFNEVKLYDTMRETNKDFSLKKTDAVDGVIVPRVFKTNIGDIYTTNCIDPTATITKGAKLVPNAADGMLKEKATPAGTDMVWEVVDPAATMADGCVAVKLRRIQ